MASIYVNSYAEVGLRISTATMGRFGFSVIAERISPYDEMALVRTDGEQFTDEQEEWLTTFGQGLAAAIDLLDAGVIRALKYHKREELGNVF